MTAKAAILWDEPGTFNRFVNECCGVSCDPINQLLVASPFYRGRYVALIVPTGFANPRYSRLLPALRAASGRIRTFVENGGHLLIFGAMDERPGAYDWLPFRVEYRHDFGQRKLVFPAESEYAAIVEDYDTDAVETDGVFPDADADVIAATPEGEAVVLAKQIGKGVVVVTSIHEYPSARFVGTFCTAERETLF
ncbi:hypothetical protein [Methanofollis ethanolicus]|uniref:hypothetical protein n=1 Tax=Methanofollis ethanolicus TaxID=488124 RepID=UPI00082B1A0A|nr:hypothetical protein [Methanofollis ethanolicus]